MTAETKVTGAVRQCVERCVQTTDIFAEIDRFFLELERTGEWTAEELQQLEEGVVGALFGVLDYAAYPSEVTGKRSPAAENPATAEAVC